MKLPAGGESGTWFFVPVMVIQMRVQTFSCPFPYFLPLPLFYMFLSLLERRAWAPEDGGALRGPVSYAYISAGERERRGRKKRDPVITIEGPKYQAVTQFPSRYFSLFFPGFSLEGCTRHRRPKTNNYTKTFRKKTPCRAPSPPSLPSPPPSLRPTAFHRIRFPTSRIDRIYPSIEAKALSKPRRCMQYPGGNSTLELIGYVSHGWLCDSEYIIFFIYLFFRCKPTRRTPWGMVSVPSSLR